MTEIEEKQGDFEMYFGPAHPGSGNFSVRVQLRGERVMKAVVDPGYLHRGFEKLMEYREPALHPSHAPKRRKLQLRSYNKLKIRRRQEILDYCYSCSNFHFLP